MKYECTQSSKQSGSTLIEVLITVLVLSIGLLGMATLQFDAVKLNHDAFLRSQAVNLAYDMSDRIRSNRSAARDGDYDTQPAPSGVDATAAADITAWQANLAAALPTGTGTIARNSEEFTVQVCWDESRGGGAPATCFSFVTGL
ncbi:type IV pilus modification protein PilV [Neptunomonas japonica]|uniref:Type IV pilus assembly protein PilV n=1 Tax=Neptunomonas japonica JAMM 1380 TaxID=1441457 RepID=A0A7R6PXD4_9GAMM|nr:type IV pilus modification protein PilV [Neptunomonas japonica]BBB31303.1 type IV pilus assembly protein PilV [Neptunomonas japonica JAMM 1380]